MCSPFAHASAARRSTYGLARRRSIPSSPWFVLRIARRQRGARPAPPAPRPRRARREMARSKARVVRRGLRARTPGRAAPARVHRMPERPPATIRRAAAAPFRAGRTRPLRCSSSRLASRCGAGVAGWRRNVRVDDDAAMRFIVLHSYSAKNSEPAAQQARACFTVRRSEGDPGAARGQDNGDDHAVRAPLARRSSRRSGVCSMVQPPQCLAGHVWGTMRNGVAGSAADLVEAPGIKPWAEKAASHAFYLRNRYFTPKTSDQSYRQIPRRSVSLHTVGSQSGARS